MNMEKCHKTNTHNMEIKETELSRLIRLVKNEKDECFAICGNYRITENFETFEEVEEHIKKNVIDITIRIYDTIKQIEKNNKL